MKFLEPPFNEPLTVESVARAYSILQQAAEMSNHNGGGNAHFRIQQIQSILSNTPFDNQEWIQPQTDLYRALLLSSFLWLELLHHHGGNVDAGTTRRILQSSVEQCLLLLHVLYHRNHGVLPKSRHALLQAVLDEPLLPLDQQQRQLSYILQQTETNNEKEECSISENDEEFMVATMNRKELLREEEELRKLASTPLPTISVAGKEKETHNDGLVHCGPLMWIQTDSSKTCHVSLYDCGLLTATSPSHNGTTMRSNDPPQIQAAWLLSPSSTCEIQTNDSVHTSHRDGMSFSTCNTIPRQ